MMRIRRECNRRGITRLCHFTQSRNLAHILGDCVGILSRRRLESNDFLLSIPTSITLQRSVSKIIYSRTGLYC